MAKTPNLSSWPPGLIQSTMKAGAKADAEAKEKQKRKRFYERVVADVRGGKIDEAEGAKRLRNAGFPDDKNPFTNADAPGVGGVLHAVAKPLGLSRSENIKLAAAKREAYKATHPGATDFQASVPQAGTVAAGPASLVAGPIKNLVFGTGAGLAQSAVYAPAGVASLVTHPVRTAEELVGGVKSAVTDPTKHPANAALLAWALLSGGGALGARTAAASKTLARGEGLRTAATRSSAQGGSLLHTPAPGVATIHLPHTRRDVYNADADVWEPMIGPVEATPVDRLLSRNVLVRNLIQKPKAARIQKRVLEDRPTTRLGRGTFSAEATIGRERRAQRRVNDALQRAGIHEQGRAVHGIFGKLSRGEQAAIGVIGVEGPAAFTDTAAVIQRHIATHQHFANMSDDLGKHAARIADLKLAQVALENPSPRLQRAAALTANISQQTENALVQANLLNPATAAGRKNAMAQIYGLEQAPEGSFFFPMTKRYTMPVKPIGGVGPGGVRPGPAGVGPPSVSHQLPGLHQQFTGESVAQGLTPLEVASTITDRALRTQRLVSTLDEYDEMRKFGSPVKRSADDVPLRDTPEVRDDLRDFLAEQGDRVHATPDELASLDQGELEALTAKLTANEALTANIGEGVPGVVFVPRQYFADLGEVSIRGWIEKTADAITNPIRTADIYASPAYILNLAGNLGMAGITQGVRTFPSLKRAVTAPHEQTRFVDALMHSSLSRSYAVPTGPLGQFNTRLGEAWNAVTDLHVRRSAWYHEAARAGFNTDDEIMALITNPRNRRKLVEVTRRSNKNIVDFSSMTRAEKDKIRRLIFFYPWISRATLWSLRMLVENPGKSFTLAQLGDVGAEHAHEDFPGGLPRWAEHSGIFRVGGSDETPRTMNLSSVWTGSTAAAAGRTLVESAKGLAGVPFNPREGLGQSVTPAAGLLAQQLGAEPGSGRMGGIPGLVTGTPQWQALRRSNIAPGVFGEPPVSYPQTGAAGAIPPYLFHGAYPRPTAAEELHKQHYKEQPRDTRAAIRMSDEQKRFRSELGRLMPGTRIPPEVEKAYETQTRREIAYAKLPKDATQQDRLRADVALALELGIVNQDEASEALRASKNLTDKEISRIRSRWNRELFGGKALGYAKKVVREAGGVLSLNQEPPEG